MSDWNSDLLLGYITAILITLILVLGIAIPRSISEERNIEKELKIKEMEIYKEERSDDLSIK